MAEQLTDEDWAVWDAFYMMRRRLDRALERELVAGSGVSAPDYEILVGLGRSADRRLRVRDIAEQIGWEKSRVSHQVTRMERRGLVRRTECDIDARGTWVELTAEGRRAMLKSSRGHNEAIKKYFVDVLGEEADTLRDFSQRVLDAIVADACSGESACDAAEAGETGQTAATAAAEAGTESGLDSCSGARLQT